MAWIVFDLWHFDFGFDLDYDFDFDLINRMTTKRRLTGDRMDEGGENGGVQQAIWCARWSEPLAFLTGDAVRRMSLPQPEELAKSVRVTRKLLDVPCRCWCRVSVQPQEKVTTTGLWRAENQFVVRRDFACLFDEEFRRSDMCSMRRWSVFYEHLALLTRHLGWNIL